MQSDKLKIVDTFLKIRGTNNSRKDLVTLTFEMARILDNFPEVESHFKSRVDMFYKQSLGE